MPYRMLLDTSSLMYRAYFSHPVSIRDDEGRPVNALHGYLDFVSYLHGARRPDEIVHCYDHNWRPDDRVAVYAGYKAQRKPDPEGLPEQFVILREVLDAFGLPQAEAPGWEGEDTIGAICAGGTKRDRFDIVTGDRDLLQLVRDPTVRVLFTVKGVRVLHEFDEAAVEAKYGIPPARYADFAILRGDPSDGLPGVRGVGEKTAAEIVRSYPSLAAVVADASATRRTGPPLQRSGSLRASIREAADYIAAMEDVVPIRSDVPVDRWRRERDDERLDKLADRYRLTGPIGRLRAALGRTRT
jgi:5'-3' exonuclease